MTRAEPYRGAMILARVLTLVCVVATSAHAQEKSAKLAKAPPGKYGVDAPSPTVTARKVSSKVDYVPQGRYDELKNWVVRARSTGGTLFNSPDGETNYMLVVRSVASNAEEHSRWDDIVVVRSGSGFIEIGKGTTGARFLAAGELRGGTLKDPARLELKPGDVARIPAGVPHAFTPNAGEPWEFLLVKVRRPNKPLKRPPPDAK